MNFTSRQYSKYNSADSRPDGNQRNDGNQRFNSNQRSDQRRPAPFCPICKKNGRPESEYNSHFIRETSDENSPITCPILLSMECNHCGEKGHIVAKCPHKKCVYCNEAGHTVSRCTAAPKEVIDQFLDQRHQNYMNREQRRENVFQRNDQRNDQRHDQRNDQRNDYQSQRYDQSQRHDQRQEIQKPIAPPTPSISAMFEDAPSLSKKSVKTTSAPTISYSAVAEIAAPLAVPKKKIDEKKVEEEDYEDDSDEYIENNDDNDSVHSATHKQPINYDDMTLKEKLSSCYDNDNEYDW